MVKQLFVYISQGVGTKVIKIDHLPWGIKTGSKGERICKGDYDREICKKAKNDFFKCLMVDTEGGSHVWDPLMKSFSADWN